MKSSGKRTSRPHIYLLITCSLLPYHTRRIACPSFSIPFVSHRPLRLSKPSRANVRVAASLAAPVGSDKRLCQNDRPRQPKQRPTTAVVCRSLFLVPIVGLPLLQGARLSWTARGGPLLPLLPPSPAGDPAGSPCWPTAHSAGACSPVRLSLSLGRALYVSLSEGWERSRLRHHQQQHRSRC